MTRSPLLSALHLASTTLPVGAFSYSQGLEWAVECGTVTDRISAERWMLDSLHWSLRRFEAPLLVAAQRAWLAGDDDAVLDLNDRMIATRESRELRAETLQMGFSLRRWCVDTAALDEAWQPRIARIDEPSYPIGFAAIAAAWQLDPQTMRPAYLLGWLENQVNAALKAIPLGQTDGQRILLAAGPAIETAQRLAGAASALAPGGRSTQCPGPAHG